jgi:glycogen debranching enzyme
MGRFLHQVDVSRPYPVRVLYPAINPGDSDWRAYFLVNMQNLPHHYHNGGIWPLAGGLWVRLAVWANETVIAERAMQRLAQFCRSGMDYEWEFNEWGHGQSGKPMGKAYQAWSAASYAAAYLSFQGEEGVEVIPPSGRKGKVHLVEE